MPRPVLRTFAAVVMAALSAAASVCAARAQTPAASPAPANPPATPPAGAKPDEAAAKRAAPAKPEQQSRQEPPRAEPAKPEQPPQKGSVETPAVVIDSAETLLGKEVRSSKGEDLGRIVDVIIDRNGVIQAAIIDFGGFLGMGSRKIAVDWRMLHFPKDGSLDKLVADLPQDQLRIAPLYRVGEPVVVIGKVAAAPKAEPVAAAPEAKAPDVKTAQPARPAPAATTAPAAPAPGAKPAPGAGAPSKNP